MSLVPLLAAAAFVAIVVVIRIWLADGANGFVDAGRGRSPYPLGYRNANACFFVVAGLAAVAVLTRPRSNSLVRAGVASLAACAFAIAAISQSRGSLVGLLAGAFVLVAVAPSRGRALLGLAISLIPVAVLFGELIGPYEAAADSQPILPELQGAASAAIAAAFVARTGGCRLGGHRTASPNWAGRVPLPSPPDRTRGRRPRSAGGGGGDRRPRRESRRMA